MSTRGTRRTLVLLLGSVATLLAAVLVPASAQAGVANWVDQIGTYDSLISPNYTGVVPVKSFINDQTIGIGTFDHLDGELVMVGGIAYRVGTDGTPHPVTDEAKTPFFEAIDFAPDWSGPVAPGTTCANLLGAVNKLAQSDAGVVAVRVRGTFADLVTRSVPAQTMPYAPLSDVVAKQTVFQLGTPASLASGPPVSTCMASPLTGRPADTYCRAWQEMTCSCRWSVPPDSASPSASRAWPAGAVRAGHLLTALILDDPAQTRKLFRTWMRLHSNQLPRTPTLPLAADARHRQMR